MDKIKAKLLKEERDPGLAGMSQLIGKRIVDIGIVLAEGCGFTIDYEDNGQIKRIILEFSDLGMWVAWHGVKGKLNSEDILGQNVQKLMDDYSAYFDAECSFDVDKYSVSSICEIVDDARRLCFHVKYINLWNETYEFDIALKDLYKIKNPNLLKLMCEINKDWDKILSLISSFAILNEDFDE